MFILFTYLKKANEYKNILRLANYLSLAIFVLVTNTNQLQASINHRYGDSVNAQQYLEKCFKLAFVRHVINEHHL
ncbi:P-loop NTPase fold protein [Vibrio pelagius]|uniref:P-loop NTPase fold protein n=1 Tax=Vibrio pelagius TaxID=28169 RepID=UPI003B838160